MREHQDAVSLPAGGVGSVGTQEDGVGSRGQGVVEGDRQRVSRAPPRGQERVGEPRGPGDALEGTFRAREGARHRGTQREAEAAGLAEQDAARGDPRRPGHRLRPALRGDPRLEETHRAARGGEGQRPLHAPGGGHRGGRCRGRRAMDGHPGAAVVADRARAPPPPRAIVEGPCAWAGRGSGRHCAGRAHQRRAAEEPQSAHGFLPLSWPHGSGEDGDGQGLGGGALRQRDEDDPLGHVRIHGETRCVAAHRCPPRLHRPRGGRPAHGGAPPQPLRRGPLRRAGEGAPRRPQCAVAVAGRRAHHGLAGEDGGLLERGVHYDLEHGPGAIVGRGALRQREGCGVGEEAVRRDHPQVSQTRAAEPLGRHYCVQPALAGGVARGRATPTPRCASTVERAGHGDVDHGRRGGACACRGLRPRARRPALAEVARALRRRRPVAEGRRRRIASWPMRDGGLRRAGPARGRQRFAGRRRAECTFRGPYLGPGRPRR
mmetsp:Transcript_88732/g.173543  ORF Transcript_88732/g.173543 Transcript_88732/m.173543 type:complete len:489 (+) Transcript_88732:1275-2741(+)